jgi:hypothetical protein
METRELQADKYKEIMSDGNYTCSCSVTSLSVGDIGNF